MPPAGSCSAPRDSRGGAGTGTGLRWHSCFRDGQPPLPSVAPQGREPSAAGTAGGCGPHRRPGALKFAHACQARHGGVADRARNAGETTRSIALKSEKRKESRMVRKGLVASSAVVHVMPRGTLGALSPLSSTEITEAPT